MDDFKEYIDHDEKNEKQKKRDEILKREKDKELEDLKKVLSLPEGRRFIWKILSETGMYRSCFGSEDRITNYLEGKRDIGILVVTEVHKASVSAYAQMQKEFLNRQKEISKQLELLK